MASLDQLFNIVKQLNEKYNLLVSNAKKTEELPEMETMNSEGLIRVSEQVDGVWVSKFLEIQKIIDGLSLSGQDNKVREITLGSITEDHDLNYLLDNQGITVTETEIVVLTALVVIDNQLLQRQFLWKLGKGEFNPIGSANINTKVLELQPKFLNEITSDELTNSPIAIVYDFGIITDPILDVLNTASPARDYSDDTRIYYVRATLDGVKLLYNFIGTNGIYGDGELQMTADDLVLVYSSQNVDISTLLGSKTNRGGYTGTSQQLAVRIDNIENYGKWQYESYWLDLNPTGVVTDLDLSTTDSTSLNFTGAMTELNSVIYNSAPTQPYNGKEWFIKNSQEIPFNIMNEVGDIETEQRYIFSLPDDLTVNPGQIVHLKELYLGGNRGKIELVGVSGSSASTPLASDTITGTVKTSSTESDPVVYTKADADNLLADKADLVTGKVPQSQSQGSDLSYNSTTGVVTLTDATGTTHEIDLPIENLFQNASYNSGTQTLTLTTNGGGTIDVDLATLVDLPEIVVSDSSNPVTTPSTGQRLYLRADIGSYWIASAGAWSGPFLGVTSAEKATWNAKQDALGYTAENSANKSSDVDADKTSTTKYATVKAIYDWAVGKFQAALVSGTNIKTINSGSILGSGDLDFNALYAPKSIPVVQIGTNTTLDDTYNGKVILLTASCTITLPNGLATNFGVTIATKATVTLTLALGGSVTLLNNTGTTMAEKLSCTLLNTGTANEYLTAGNL